MRVSPYQGRLTPENRAQCHLARLVLERIPNADRRGTMHVKAPILRVTRGGRGKGSPTVDEVDGQFVVQCQGFTRPVANWRF